MIKVINGTQLKGKISDSDKPYFYETSGRKKEEEYKQLIIDSQPYFRGIINGTISLEDDYFIYAPQSYLDNGIAIGVSVVTNGVAGVNARLLYLNNPIKVKRQSDGFYFASSDGRHRYAVAQKYELDILVDEVEKITYNLEEKQEKNTIFKKIKSVFKIR